MLFQHFKQACALQKLPSSLLCNFPDSYLVPLGVDLGVCALMERRAKAINSRPDGDR